MESRRCLDEQEQGPGTRLQFDLHGGFDAGLDRLIDAGPEHRHDQRKYQLLRFHATPLVAPTEHGNDGNRLEVVAG